MNRIGRPVRVMLLLIPAIPLLAVDASGADFGLQPVPLGAGARALGMGGAFSAVADDASAVTWNPAGLTQCERPEVAMSLGWYRTDTRAQAEGGASSQALRPDHISGLLPFFAFGCQQVLGVAWQRQFDFGRSKRSQAEFIDLTIPFISQSQEWNDSSGSFASLGLSYAIELRPGLSCGFTINRWDDSWTSASHYQSSLQADYFTSFAGIDVDSRYDVSARTRIASGTSAVLGAFWQATPALTLAVVAKPSDRMRLEQSSHVRSVVDDGTVTVTSYDTATAAVLHHPSSLTLGVAWREDDLCTLTCDATVTSWHQYRIEDDSNVTSPVNGALVPGDFPDLWTFRLGYEYVAILPRVILVTRFGLLLEDLPAATKAPSLSTVDQVSATHDRWLGVTAGLSICQRSLIWDLGVQVRYGNNVGAGQFAPADQTVDMLVTTARLGLTVQF